MMTTCLLSEDSEALRRTEDEFASDEPSEGIDCSQRRNQLVPPRPKHMRRASSNVTTASADSTFYSYSSEDELLNASRSSISTQPAEVQNNSPSASAGPLQRKLEGRPARLGGHQRQSSTVSTRSVTPLLQLPEEVKNQYEVRRPNLRQRALAPKQQRRSRLAIPVLRRLAYIRDSDSEDTRPSAEQNRETVNWVALCGVAVVVLAALATYGISLTSNEVHDSPSLSPLIEEVQQFEEVATVAENAAAQEESTEHISLTAFVSMMLASVAAIGGVALLLHPGDELTTTMESKCAKKKSIAWVQSNCSSPHRSVQ